MVQKGIAVQRFRVHIKKEKACQSSDLMILEHGNWPESWLAQVQQRPGNPASGLRVYGPEGTVNAEPVNPY